MKNKKQNFSVPSDTVDDAAVMVAEKEVQRPGILKSALKRGSKKYSRKKHRVQFNESLNKFFEADYVILVRDDEYDDDEDLEEVEYGQCECGNQFCYEGCYYADEVEEDGDYAEYHRHPSSVDSPRFDFAAAFEPPFEFVDPVTLSPPDGYKDAGCGPDSVLAAGPNKVSASTMTNHDGPRNENRGKLRNESNASFGEKTKILQQQQQEKIDDASGAKKDQRNQGYMYHPNEVNTSGPVAVFGDTNAPAAVGIGGSQSRYIVETITMTTVTERRIVRESNDQVIGEMLPADSSKYSSGILKGGKLWRSSDSKAESDPIVPSANERGIKFVHEDTEEGGCDKTENEKGEFTLTFKLGNRVVPCNSLKPNSAVRQLFPDPRFADPPSSQPGCGEECDENLGKCEGKYLVTEESLRAFNEVNRRSVFATFGGKERYPYKDTHFAVNSDDEDIPQNDLIKKTIERNTLRRSLMRYPRGKNHQRKKKAEPSLEERIKQLTCNIDDECTTDENAPVAECAVMPPRSSPPGEESRQGPSTSVPVATTSKPEKSAYKKFTDLFRNKSDNQAVVEQPYAYYQPVYQAAQPDLGIDMKIHGATLIVAKKSAGPNESRKQFLSSLAPLTACVTGHVEPNYGNRDTLKLKIAGDRNSIISTTSTGTEYSVGDIDESKVADEKAPQPDVVAGTPNADSSQDELAMFVQQDAGRIERIKKRYNSAATADDDEHDDYGFSRRPSVRSIKPRFGSTTEILQQMQAHLQPPLLACTTKPGSHMTWPYYSTECTEAAKTEATSPRNSLPTLKEESTAEYTAKLVWEKSASTSTLPPRIGIAPQPLKIDAAAPCGNVHMFRLTPSDTLAEMVMPYGKGDGCADPRRLSGNGSNIFQMKVSPVGSVAGAAAQVRLPINVTDGAQFAAAHPIQVGTTSVIRVGHGQQQTFRVPCPVGGPVQVHLLATHHHHYESPQVRCTSQPVLHAHPVHPAIPYQASAVPLAHHHPQQIVLAKGTQTSTISSTSFYQLQTNAPMGTGYPTTIAATSAVATAATCKSSVASGEPAKLIQLNYTVAHQAVAPIATLNSSPTRIKSHNQLAERGIPEGAVSTNSADSQDSAKSQLQPSVAEPAPPVPGKNTASATPSYGMKV